MQILLSAVQRSQGCLPLHLVFFNLHESQALPTLFFFELSRELLMFEAEPEWETGTDVEMELDAEFEFEFNRVDETGEEEDMFECRSESMFEGCCVDLIISLERGGGLCCNI